MQEPVHVREIIPWVMRSMIGPKFPDWRCARCGVCRTSAVVPGGCDGRRGLFYCAPCARKMAQMRGRE